MKSPPTIPRNNAIDEESINVFVARVGERVKQLRQQKAISRRVLSEQSGVSQRYLAQLETGSGNISIGLLYKVAAALGHKPDWLLAEDDPWDSEFLEFSNLYRTAEPNQRSKALEALHPGSSMETKADRICLIGLRGAGKSTLGQRVADELGVEFLELNRVIESQSGIAVSEVMALYGQEGYRQLERKALDTIVENNTSVVLAVGGGIVSEPETFGQLVREFHTVWLKASPEEHMERVRQQGDDRPMAGNPKAMDELKSILTSREYLYSRADNMVDTNGRSVAQSAADLLAVISELRTKA